jgi:hypothetical protein
MCAAECRVHGEGITVTGMDGVDFTLPKGEVGFTSRTKVAIYRDRCRTALLALLAALTAADENAGAWTHDDATVPELVDQLVPPLIAAPGAPPVRRVALLAA